MEQPALPSVPGEFLLSSKNPQRISVFLFTRNCPNIASSVTTWVVRKYNPGAPEGTVNALVMALYLQ